MTKEWFIFIVKPPTQPQPNHHPPTTTTQTQCQQYLSCYSTNFDETLNVGSWEHLEQIPTVLLGVI